jgi:hypothetical protein
MVFRQQTHLPIVVSAALHHNQSFTPTTTTTISEQASNTIQKEMREDGESVRSTNSGAQTDKTTGSMEGGLRGFGRGQHSVKQKTLGSEIRDTRAQAVIRWSVRPSVAGPKTRHRKTNLVGPGMLARSTHKNHQRNINRISPIDHHTTRHRLSISKLTLQSQDPSRSFFSLFVVEKSTAIDDQTLFMAGNCKTTGPIIITIHQAASPPDDDGEILSRHTRSTFSLHAKPHHYSIGWFPPGKISNRST